MHACPDVPSLSVAYVRVTRRRVVVPMTDIWVAAAWVMPIFAAAAGTLLFGYLRFLRWSQAEERQAMDVDAAVKTVARLPAPWTRSDARAAA